MTLLPSSQSLPPLPRSQPFLLTDLGHHFSFGQSNDRHWLRRFWQQFFARGFAPRPPLLLKFGHMIYVGYIYHVSKFQQQRRSRSKTSGKKLMSNKVSAVPPWNTSARFIQINLNICHTVVWVLLCITAPRGSWSEHLSKILITFFNRIPKLIIFFWL